MEDTRRKAIRYMEEAVRKQKTSELLVGAVSQAGLR